MGLPSLSQVDAHCRPGSLLFGLRLAACCAVLLVLSVAGAPALAQRDPFAGPRAEMVRTIAAYARISEEALGRTFITPEVMEVMGSVPRHAFLPEGTGGEGWLSGILGRDLASIAYADRPVPIGYGQTMSQPFIVALMTDLLAPAPDHVVLEVGTGSGYQAAVLSPLVRRVCSIEIIPELGRSAAAALKRQGYGNVETRIGDGYYGWEECGPFDGIVVTAAAGHVPPPLITQLKPDGRMVIPVGGPFAAQQLTLVEKTADGRVRTRQLLPVAFVPLVRATP
ncbi:MAG: protein-L-isoaspartate(D-aspartate) O-methyltransferase [Rhodospirillales bacterium]|nr:MAG: protein-L-isoaspartate(D-aspartate) O-methyltransferase [Rhodospirillales bacterium]